MNEEGRDSPILCVKCRQRPVEKESFPFCSERCRLLDLGEWAREEYRVPGAPAPELLEEDSVQIPRPTDGSGNNH